MENSNNEENTKKYSRTFLVEFVKDPLGKLHEIANTESNQYFKIAIIILILFTIYALSSAIKYEVYYLGFSKIVTVVLSATKKTIAPLISISIYSIIILILNQKNKKKLATILSTITISKLPMIIICLLGFLTFFSYKFTTIFECIQSLLTVISAILGFFAMQYLFNEESKEFIKTYVLIEVIYYIFSFFIGLIGIYI